MVKKYKLKRPYSHIDRKIFYGIYGIILILIFIRAFYSVELTDEAYGIAEIYNCSFGKKPFIDIWDSHTGWFLLVPFLKIYCIFSPQMRGVILYFRILFFLIAFVILEVTYRLLKTDKTNYFLHICSVVCISYVSFSIPTLGYDTGVSYCIILVFALLYKGAEYKHKYLCYLIAGVTMGISCILYPTMCVCSLLLTILILIYTEKNYRKKAVLFYTFGVAIIGFSFLVWVLTGSKLVYA